MSVLELPLKDGLLHCPRFSKIAMVVSCLGKGRKDFLEVSIELEPKQFWSPNAPSSRDKHVLMVLRAESPLRACVQHQLP